MKTDRWWRVDENVLLRIHTAIKNAKKQLVELGDPEEAAKALERALKLTGRLVESDPDGWTEY